MAVYAALLRDALGAAVWCAGRVGSALVVLVVGWLVGSRSGLVLLTVLQGVAAASAGWLWCGRVQCRCVLLCRHGASCTTSSATHLGCQWRPSTGMPCLCLSWRATSLGVMMAARCTALRGTRSSFPQRSLGQPGESSPAPAGSALKTACCTASRRTRSSLQQRCQPGEISSAEPPAGSTLATALHGAESQPEQSAAEVPAWQEQPISIPGGQHPDGSLLHSTERHPDDSVAFLSWLLALSKALEQAMAVACTTLEAAGRTSGHSGIKVCL